MRTRRFTLIAAGWGLLFCLGFVASPPAWADPILGLRTISVGASVGSNAHFQVTATGTLPISYAWFKVGDEAQILADTNEYTIVNVQKSHAGDYNCRIWNAVGEVYTGPIPLTVWIPPGIVQNLEPKTVSLGGDIMFTVVASGDEPLAYWWYKVLPGDDELLITCPCPSYMISDAIPSDEGDYYCIVRNGGGSAWTHTVHLTVGDGPQILLHPLSQTVTAGNSVTFTVAATGTPPFHYDWRKGGVSLGAPDLPTYSIASVTAARAGQYTCRVTNAAGEALSNAATLTVLGPPYAAFSHVPHSGSAPLTVKFTNLSLSGGTPIQSRNWSFGDGTSSTAANPTHTYTNPGAYAVQLTINNSAFSDTVTVPGAVRVYDGGAGVDTDGEGLSDAIEVGTHGTDPANPDSDGDGMDDGWEVAYGLNPLSIADANADNDVDGLTNLDEYRLRSNPLDPASPARVYYAATTGSDTTGNGSSGNPWRSIGHAINQLEPAQGSPVTLRLAAGVYVENVTLKPWLTLRSTDAAAPAAIEGFIAGAAGSSLQNLIVQQPDSLDAFPLLLVYQPMTGKGVTFVGTADASASGIAVYGTGHSATIFEDCEFTSLTNGVDIYGALPVIRRCWFHDLAGSAIEVHDGPLKVEDTTLSAEEDPNSGYNTIDLETIEGEEAVVNERDEDLIIENNDWGTDDEDEVGERVSAGTDYIPILAKGSAVGAATAHCCVWDAASELPVTNASIQLSPGTFLPVTANTGGVYTFACLAPGAYTFAVTASGYTKASKSQTLAAADNIMLHFPLTEGGDTPSGGCGGGIAERVEAPPASILRGRGADLAIWLAVVAAFIAARKRMASRQV